MEKKDIYLIKDLARLAGISIYTIKYYIKLGLIKEMGRSPETRFRYFDDLTVGDLKKIIAYKREKMSLSSILDILKEKKAR
ncbi:MAG: MerR family transcriptional regulator [Candidatus Omnitrophota bacterium]|nr:MerR family transcriptional regulator [Candidatus Omnitrophota bacterium]